MIRHQEIGTAFRSLPDDQHIVRPGLDQVRYRPDPIPGLVDRLEPDQLEEEVLAFLKWTRVRAGDLHRQARQLRGVLRRICPAELHNRAIVDEPDAFQLERLVTITEVHRLNRLEMFGLVGQQPQLDLALHAMGGAKATDRQPDILDGGRRIRSGCLDQRLSASTTSIAAAFSRRRRRGAGTRPPVCRGHHFGAKLNRCLQCPDSLARCGGTRRSSAPYESTSRSGPRAR